MPIVKDPSKLTISKLKEELKRYNVKLPPSGSKKQVFVDLYTEHITGLNDPEIFQEDLTEVDAESEIESEVEESSRENNEEQGEESEETVDIKEEGKVMDVEQLTDKELADELRELGFRPGPIGATTRRVYEKKLIKLRQNIGKEVRVSPKLIEKKFKEVPDDEDNQPPAKPRSPRRRPPPRRIPVEEPEEPDDDIPMEPVEQRITEEPTLTRRPMTARTRGQTGRGDGKPTATETKKPAEEKSGGLPLWIKILAFLLVVFFVYLVIANMEPSAGGKIPQSITGET